jgi:hypothetical protein
MQAYMYGKYGYMHACLCAYMLNCQYVYIPDPGDRCTL